MGEVYRAEDSSLHTEVALKVLRSELDLDETSLRRFRREILLARQVTHPNVCRTFEAFHCESDTGPATTFLTMELLRGETLTQLLRRRRRLDDHEALPIALQLVAALEAAHAVQIIHRDLKSGNVLLVPSPSGSSRAVVTDFGLACVAQTESTASATGEMIGTSAYMAPEQVRGGHVTPVADIYALGVLLYEMVTGVRPFVGESALCTALKRLEEAPVPPTRLVPELAPRWEPVILRCLARDPAARFSSAAEVADALRGAGETATSSWRSPHRRRAALLTAAASLLLASSGGGSVFHRGRAAVDAPEAVASPRTAVRSVALLGFRNLSGDGERAWISSALCEMFATELGSATTLRVVPAESVTRMKADLAMISVESLGVDTLRRVRAYLNADIVVVGSYLALGSEPLGQLRYNLQAQDTRTGKTLAALADSGSTDTLFLMISRSGRRLRQNLGALEATDGSAEAVRASIPASPEAARYYTDGLEQLHLEAARAARDLLLRATDLEPQHALSHAALSKAWALLGYGPQSIAEAERALALSRALPRSERLRVEGLYYEASRNWTMAIETYRALRASRPHEYKHVLNLATAQIEAGRGREALATIAELRGEPGEADPRVGLVKANALASLSDFEGLASVAVATAKRAESLGARQLVAKARMREGWALQHLGRPEAAIAAFGEARRMFEAASQRRGVAWSSRNVGFVLWRRGQLDEAQTEYDRALGVFEEIGDDKGAAVTLNALAMIAETRGALVESRRLAESALALFHSMGDSAGTALAMNSLAAAVGELGETQRALGILQESKAIHAQVGDTRMVATTLNLIGQLRHREGDLEAARGAIEGALRLNQDIGLPAHVASDLYQLAELSRAAGRVAEAREHHERALAIRRELGETLGQAESRLALSNLELAEGRADPAAELARAASRAFDAEKEPGAAAISLARLARALVLQGQLPEASRATEQARGLARNSQSHPVRVLVTVETAPSRVAADRARASGEISQLELALGEATRSGWIDLALEARLALGEVELLCGRRASGMSRLTVLERDARSLGFEAIARAANGFRAEGRF
jgi:tetratricopeptide (TPR) repeat protein/TolB-like protein